MKIVLNLLCPDGSLYRKKVKQSCIYDPYNLKMGQEVECSITPFALFHARVVNVKKKMTGSTLTLKEIVYDLQIV